ncbi:unnamed protein product [Amoebophrya sp. A25]|nr:unnamed protein product [Amoebophrya sp. A25]|eukprot:GSA25T00027385001.1
MKDQKENRRPNLTQTRPCLRGSLSLLLYLQTAGGCGDFFYLVFFPSSRRVFAWNCATSTSSPVVAVGERLPAVLLCRPLLQLAGYCVAFLCFVFLLRLNVFYVAPSFFARDFTVGCNSPYRVSGCLCS